MGDLNAQLAACNVGARRLRDLADLYGRDLLTSVFDELLDRVAERGIRLALRLIDRDHGH